MKMKKMDDKPLFLLRLLFLESRLATLCQQISAHGIALGMCQNRATGGFTQHAPLYIVFTKVSLYALDLDVKSRS